MSLMILADDLSGAADCAIGFAAAGCRTTVTLGAPQGVLAPDIEVIAADLDSRRLPPAQAASVARDAWRVLHTPGRYLYKKIDSTLRGNWAAETAALAALAGVAIVSPAFPATGRVMRGAQVSVNGTPLEQTDIWRLEHGRASAHVGEMLSEAGLRTRALPVTVLRGDEAAARAALAEAIEAGAQALVVDAETAADLVQLARASLGLDTPFFWVGSGGLARELPALGTLCAPRNTAHVLPPLPDGARVVMVGSLSPVSHRQCERLLAAHPMQQIEVPPALLRAGADPAGQQAQVAAIGAVLARHESLLLRIGRDDDFDPAEGARLSSALAALVAPHFHHVAALVATGGETARAMLSATGVDALELLDEIEPGLPVSRAHGGHAPGVVTKAGAFGSDDALRLAYEHLLPSASPSDGVPVKQSTL